MDNDRPAVNAGGPSRLRSDATTDHTNFAAVRRPNKPECVSDRHEVASTLSSSGVTRCHGTRPVTVIDSTVWCPMNVTATAIDSNVCIFAYNLAVLAIDTVDAAAMQQCAA